ncbi:hypothetical protein C8R44DRAFT_973049 [Mycena epipterygia]|nr:hypothetical protein C8R44DRAFT_973049 [Mycena epipterygia]
MSLRSLHFQSIRRSPALDPSTPSPRSYPTLPRRFFRNIRTPYPSRGPERSRMALALGKQLGLQFQPPKIFGPATELEFLGLEFDTVAMEVRLPAEKLTYLIELFTSWSQCFHCRLRDFSNSLLRSSQYPTHSYAPSTIFPRNSAPTSLGAAFPKTSKDAYQEITWWLRFASEWNGRKGLGSHFFRHWFSAKCHYGHEHIQVKEVLAVVHAILCWGDKLAGKDVFFHIDDEAVFRSGEARVGWRRDAGTAEPGRKGHQGL